MQKPVLRWLARLLLNLAGLVVSLAVLFVACVAVVLQISTRAVAPNPLQNLFGSELLAALAGVVATGLVFHFCGKLYSVARQPPR